MERKMLRSKELRRIAMRLYKCSAKFPAFLSMHYKIGEDDDILAEQHFLFLNVYSYLFILSSTILTISRSLSQLKGFLMNISPPT